MLQREQPRLVVKLKDEAPTSVSVDGSGNYAVGPIQISLNVDGDDVGWEIGASGEVAVEKVALKWTVSAGKRVRIFSNGYQSWSRAGSRILGEDRDPSTHPNSIELVRAFHHADPAIAREDEIRSELVAVWDVEDGLGLTCAGFDGGAEHDGTFRFLRVEESDLEVSAEALFGGAVLQEGESRRLHSLLGSSGDSAPELLEEWAGRAGRASGARVASPYQVGWCSWYHYFGLVTEQAMRDNLALTSEFPFAVFQLDDGFQSEIGDWLQTNGKFPSGIDGIASTIQATGQGPGIWLAPFLASPESRLAKERPELIAHYKEETPLIATVNPGWGGPVYALDTTKPETLAHLEEVARSLVSAGFGYLKLDFLFASSVPGVYEDPSRTRAQRVRAGLEAIRRGAGEETFLLGCGCPLGPAIGIVDGMRIGPDVAPFWEVEEGTFLPPGYDDEAPATVNAWRNTLARSFMHRRLWLNDPDCLMLRKTQTRLTPEQTNSWARAVAVSGGMAIVSDDLSLLGPEEKRLLDEVIEVGRRSDRLAISSHPARCEDLIDEYLPRKLRSGSDTLDS